MPPPRDSPKIASQISKGLYVSDAKSALESVFAFDIDLVIALTIEDSPARQIETWLPPGDAERLRVIHNPISDSEDQDITETLDTLLPVMHEAISSGKNVLVHCASGISRAPALATAYLMKYRYSGKRAGFLGPLDFAAARVCSARPIASINPGFRRQLAEFEASCL